MAKEENNEKRDEENDLISKAIEYQTINTTGLFERGNPALKISRGGVVNIRIEWAAIIWGGCFGVLTLLFNFLLFVKILKAPGTVSAFFIITATIIFTVVGAKLGTWSPMNKDTGENLVTYFKIMIRSRLARGGMGDGKQSETELFSYAVVPDGQIVNCKRWIGTQPLRNAPPMSPYKEDYRTQYKLYTNGCPRVVNSEKYQDGLGDRF